MREKILNFLRRTFRAGSVIGRILSKIVPIILIEIKAGRLRTDAEIRNLIVELVKSEIGQKYPGYEFLVGEIIDAVIAAVRDRLRNQTVN